MLRTPALYGHRGAPRELPENTMASFARALELGVDALETDAHLTSDGHLVLHHDPEGLRTAGIPVELRACTLAALRTWDVGWGFVDEKGRRPFVGKKHRVPTLEEALLAFPTTHFNVDLKQTAPDMVPATLALLRRLGAVERVRLASFSSPTLQRVRALGYEGPTGLGQSEAIAFVTLPQLLLRGRYKGDTAAQLATQVGPVNLRTRAVIDKAHALGLRADFWTVNEPAEAELLLALGADGVMTDDPAAIAPVFARWRAEHPA